MSTSPGRVLHRQWVTPPAPFAAAVASLTAAPLRPEVTVEELPAPRKLAPWGHALGVDLAVGDEEVATGRLVLLYDPDEPAGWHGPLRLVGYAGAALDPEMLRDPLLPEVCWSWLLDALAEQGAPFTAIGGTVTQTASTRFGELAGESTCEMELRVSWTPLGTDLAPHLQAWVQLLATAAGLPPPGVAALNPRPDPA